MGGPLKLKFANHFYHLSKNWDWQVRLRALGLGRLDWGDLIRFMHFTLGLRNTTKNVKIRFFDKVSTRLGHMILYNGILNSQFLTLTNLGRPRNPDSQYVSFSGSKSSKTVLSATKSVITESVPLLKRGINYAKSNQ